MKEFDLKELWSQADEGAEVWYEGQRPELAATARRKNDSVLQRIRRLVQSELLFGGLVFLGVLWWWQEMHPFFFGLMEVSILGLMYMSYRYYCRFREEIAAVPTLNIVASTEGYLNILSAYKKRLLRLSVLLMPFALVIGFMAGFGLGTENDFTALATLKFWLITIPSLLLVAIPTYFFTVWYYRFFIGSKEKELAAVLERLREEE
jgi:hypothetical protein